MTTSIKIVLCTAPAADTDRLVDALLAERLVACVNTIGPVHSRYLWRGEPERAEEMLLLMKTTADRAARLRARIAALHPYEVPEVLELSVEDGLPAYLAWVAAECRGGGAGD